MSAFIWSDEAIEFLTKGYAKGRAMSAIAAELSFKQGAEVSKSAVCGKAFRLGLKRDPDFVPHKKDSSAAALKIRPPKRQRVNPTEQEAARLRRLSDLKKAHARGQAIPNLTRSSVSLEERRAEMDAIAIEPKTITDPAFGGCRWPLYRTAEDGQTLHCCNARPNAPYCQEHTFHAFQKYQWPEQITENRKAA
jgi:hypothetical protein